MHILPVIKSASKRIPANLFTHYRIGTFGAVVEYGVERRLTPHSNLGATMIVGIPFGVTLKVKLTRASQTYTFPIHLADEVCTKNMEHF